MAKPARVYEYANCSTCKKALQFLDRHGVGYERVPIVDQPPGLAELKSMLAALEKRGGGIKNLFNTSGQLYRELGISEKLPRMSESEALGLLAKHGKLVKRPFLLAGDVRLVGFNVDEWKRAFSKS